jgi:hypothetical protein
MSVLPNQTNATSGDAFFWRVDASTITAKSFLSDRVLTDFLSTGSLSVGSISTAGDIVVSGDITAQNITATDTLNSYFANFQYAATIDGANIGGLLITSNIAGYDTIYYPLGVISSISTANITLDGNTLDTGGAGIGATLLLNGIPIATTSTSISSLVQWAIYPAVSTIIVDNNNIVEVNQLQTQTFTAFDGQIDNQLTVSQTLFGNQAEFQEVITQDLTAVTLEASLGSISSLTVSTLTANSATFNTTTTTQGFTNTLGATNFTSVTGNISDFTANTTNVGTGNVNQLNATNATISGTTTVNEVRGVNGFINAEAANRIRIRVQGSSDVFSSPELDLEAGGGNRGIVKVIANPGSGGVQGEVTISAKGGTAAGYATGGLLNLTAERGSAVLGTANTSRVGIAADSITSYAGGPTPFAGLLGYNFLYGLLGVNIVAATPPTLPNVPGTVYLYGLNPLGFGSSGGVRVQNGMSIDYITPYPQGFIAPEYDLIIKGNPAGQKVTLSNVRYIFGDGTIATGFADLLTTNLSATNLNGTNIFGTNILGSNFNGELGNISSLISLSSINGVSYPPIIPTLSTFNQLFTSSLQAQNISTIGFQGLVLTGLSSINGFSIAELVSSVSPPTPAPSTFQQLFTSSLQAVNISSITGNILALNGVSSISGFSIAELVSSVSPPTPAPSTFQQLFTSSLQAQNISTLNQQTLSITGLSSINGFTVSDFISSSTPPPSLTSTFQQLFVSSLVGNNLSTQVLNAGSVLLNGIALSPQTSTFGTLTTNLFQANQISSGLLTASTFNGYTIQELLNPPVVSTFQTLTASNAVIFDLAVSTGTIFTASNIVLNVSSINGFNTNQFLSSTGIPPQTSTFGTLTANTFQANQISSGLLTASSINGFTIQQLLNPPVASTFQQLFTSSLQAVNLSSITANILSLTGVSTLNGFTIADFVSSVAPQPPVPSTVSQFFTSSLAANSITNYQTSALNLIAPSVVISTNSLVENVGNYNLTVTSNIDINSSNYVRIYNTNTAPAVGTDDIYILGQGNTNLGSQQTTSITAANNILVNAGQNATFQGNFVVINSPQEIQLVGTQQLRGSASNIAILVPSAQSAIYLSQSNGIEINTNQSITQTALNSIGISSATVNLSGAVNINGAPYAPGLSSFITLATDTLTNNTTNTLNIKSRVQAILSTGNTILMETGEILAYSRSIIDFFAQDAVALSTQTIYLDAPITNVQGILNAPAVELSSINGLPYTTGVTVSSFSNLFTANLFNNPSVGTNLSLNAANTTLINATGAILLSTPSLLWNGSPISRFVSTATSALNMNSFPIKDSTENLTLSTIGSINLNCVVPTSVIIAPVQFATGQVFPQPGLGRFQFLTNNSAVTWDNVLITDSFANVYYNAAWGASVSLNFPITVTIGTSGYYRLSITFASVVSEYLVQYEPDGTILYGIVTPTTANFTWGQGANQAGEINLNSRETNITGVSSINLISPSLLWNGNPIGSGGGSTVSTFSNLFTSNIYVTASTVTSNLIVFDTIYNPSLGEPLVIQAAESLQLIGQVGLVLGTASNDIVFTAGILDPGAQNVTLAFCDLNLSNNNINNVDILYAGNINTTNTTTTNLFASNAIVSSINGQPYSQGISTFTNLYTTNLFSQSTIASTVTTEDVVGFDLQVYGKQSLGLLGELGMVLLTASNDIVFEPGVLDPGLQRVVIGLGYLEMCNHNVANVDTLTAGNIITTNTTTTNLFATTGNISSLTVSTINTYPVHKAFGSAWATTDPAALALLAGIVNYVDIPTRQAFNFVPDTTGNVFSLDPSNYPLNRGIYQINARCTFSNGDSNLATVSSWIDTVPNVSTTATAISRCIIQIEPNRLGTTFMTCQSLVDEFISVNCFTTSDNITLYYDPGDEVNTPPSYAMNLTAHQLYQYENPFEEYNWPPNPIPPPPPPP